MSTIQEIKQQILDDFAVFDDWMQKYEYLIDMGKSLEPLDDKYKTDENLILGCQSRAWVIAEQGPDGRIYYKGDGEAVISKGMLALIFRVVNGQKPEDILSEDFGFINDLGLVENLSPTRAYGLESMIKRVKELAEKFKNK